jgi:hypothetical protein
MNAAKVMVAKSASGKLLSLIALRSHQQSYLVVDHHITQQHINNTTLKLSFISSMPSDQD